MHRQRRFGSILFGLILVFAAREAAAVSQSTAISLTFPIGAQYSALGEAGTAVNRDVTAQWWNLGGFAFAADEGRTLHGHVMYSRLVPDLADDVALYWMGGAAYVEGWGMLGAALTYLDQGEQIQTGLDGTPGESFSSSEWAFQGSYGVKFAPNVGVGIGVKYVRIDLAPGSVLADQGASGNGSSWAADLGVLWDVTDDVHLGATLTNLGGDVTFVDEQQADPLPTNYRLGFGWDVLKTTQSRLTVIYDYMDMLVDGDETVVHGGGVEWTYASLLSVRGGYKYDDEGDIKDITWGFGFDLEQAIGTPLIFDYARVPQAQDLEQVNRFSLGVRW
jgi:hypothetical protein